MEANSNLIVNDIYSIFFLQRVCSHPPAQYRMKACRCCRRDLNSNGSMYLLSCLFIHYVSIFFYLKNFIVRIIAIRNRAMIATFISCYFSSHRIFVRKAYCIWLSIPILRLSSCIAHLN